MRSPTLGDPVIVTWMDIQQSPDGDPKEAELYPWNQVGFFFGYTTKLFEDESIECLVIAGAKEALTGSMDDGGWVIIPTAVIQNIQVLSIPTEYAEA